jgi:hypothetical protein
MLPLVLTVVAIVVTVMGATVTPGNAVPALVLEQSGHWVLDRAAATVVHVHGGTRQVDAQVALPPDAAQDGVLAVGGDTEGYVVGRDRVWTFDKSTLTVVASAPTPAAEIPVPIEVAGGPYLVYRQAGTVVRLGRPAMVARAGGPLGLPVHTDDATVWVHRPDSGAICALRRDALDLDCSAHVPPGTPGGLTVAAGAATFVDTGTDTARRFRGPALDAGAGVGADLPDDVLLGDRDAGTRLPVVTPAANLLRLLDVAGLPDLRPGGPPLDVPLGAGSFSAPMSSGAVVVVLELTGSRLLTFTTDGAKVAEVVLPPGTGAQALQRGADGRIYVDEPDGTRTHVVQPDGSVAPVDLGPGRAPGAAVAPSVEQLRPLAPSPAGGRRPGAAVDVRAAPGGPVVPVGPAGPAAPVGAPAVPGVVVPPPVPVEPDPVDAPPVGQPQPALPAPPTGLVAVRHNLSGTLLVRVDWTPPAGSPVPVTGYQVTTANTALSAGTTTTTEPTHDDLRNYCAPGVTYTVRSVAADGSTSLPVTATPAERPDCTQPTSVTSAVAEADGSVTVTVDCVTSSNSPWDRGQIEVLFDGDRRNPDLQTCNKASAEHDFHTFSITGLDPGTTYSVTSRTTSPTGPKTSDPVRVTTNP